MEKGRRVLRLSLVNAVLIAGAVVLAVVVVVQAPGWFSGPPPIASGGAGAATDAGGPGGRPAGPPGPGMAVAGKRNPFASLQSEKSEQTREKRSQAQARTLDPDKLKFEVLGVVVGKTRTYAIAASRVAGREGTFRVEVGSRLDGFQVDRITPESLWLIGEDGQRYQYELGGAQ